MGTDRLAITFREAGGEAADADLEDIERRIGQLWSRGRGAHPDLTVEPNVFAEHLGRCGADVHDGLAIIHAEDLYLACACLTESAGAVARLRESYATTVTKSVRRVPNGVAIVQEVEQRLWDGLFLGGADGPKLATYAGRGPLGAWIAVSAQRIALMMLRHERAEGRALNELAARNRLAAVDPEIAAIKDRYRAEFQSAVDAALATLDDREKMLYRMHLVEGLTLRRIARAYGVGQATIFRWLERARLRLLEEAKRRLRAALPISSGEFDSIARLLLSQIDLDISQALSK